MRIFWAAAVKSLFLCMFHAMCVRTCIPTFDVVKVNQPIRHFIGSRSSNLIPLELQAYTGTADFQSAN